MQTMQGDTAHAADRRVGRVLVVEDDDDLREVMTGALAADGHEVVEARHGAAALVRTSAATSFHRRLMRTVTSAGSRRPAPSR